MDLDDDDGSFHQWLGACTLYFTCALLVHLWGKGEPVVTIVLKGGAHCMERSYQTCSNILRSSFLQAVFVATRSFHPFKKLQNDLRLVLSTSAKHVLFVVNYFCCTLWAESRSSINKSYTHSQHLQGHRATLLHHIVQSESTDLQFLLPYSIDRTENGQCETQFIEISEDFARHMPWTIGSFIVLHIAPTYCMDFSMPPLVRIPLLMCSISYTNWLLLFCIPHHWITFQAWHSSLKTDKLGRHHQCTLFGSRTASRFFDSVLHYNQIGLPDPQSGQPNTIALVHTSLEELCQPSVQIDAE